MDTNKSFIDPLDSIINKFTSSQSSDKPETKEATTDSTIIPVVEEATTVEETTNEEMDYGDSRTLEEIEREDRENMLRAAAEKKKELESIKESDNTFTPPNERDEQYQKEAIGFQTDTISIVTDLIKSIIKSEGLPPGCVPEESRIGVMGELVQEYQLAGEITDKFTSLIVNNWVPYESGDTINDRSVSYDELDDSNDEPLVFGSPLNINITVQPDTPVTINVDESLIGEKTKTSEVNIYIHEVSEKDMECITVVENSWDQSVIVPYETGISDTPITLTYTPYRCSMKSMNWHDFVKLSASIDSDSMSDAELKYWSVIYKQMKNVSIGEFKSFEDFMKSTRYGDREILWWALLVATADDTETISLPCANTLCEHTITVDYHPRELIHIDDDLIPKWYRDASTLSGSLAKNLFADVMKKHKMYKLPDSGIIVEVDEPTAWEYIQEKIPLLDKMYREYKPEGSFKDLDVRDQSMIEFEYLMSNAIYIRSMRIIKDGKAYVYTNWEAIRKIIEISIGTDDSAILFAIIRDMKNDSMNPVSFKIENVICPKCGHNHKVVKIEDIANQLLFRVARRLANINIKLMPLD